MAEILAGGSETGGGNINILVLHVFSIREFPGLKSRDPTRDIFFVKKVVFPEASFEAAFLKKRNINHVDNCKEQEPGKQCN
jgi:hypothetical protein